MKFINRHTSFILYLVVMLIIELIDVAVGIQITLWVLYSIPIGLATWNLGTASGLLLAVVGGLLLLTTALFWGHVNASFGYYCVACASQAISYFVLVWLIGLLRNQQVERVIKPQNLR